MYDVCVCVCVYVCVCTSEHFIHLRRISHTYVDVCGVYVLLKYIKFIIYKFLAMFTSIQPYWNDFLVRDRLSRTDILCCLDC